MLEVSVVVVGPTHERKEEIVEGLDIVYHTFLTFSSFLLPTICLRHLASDKAINKLPHCPCDPPIMKT